MNRRQLGLGLLGGGATAALGACAAIDPMYQGAGGRAMAGPMPMGRPGMEMGPAEQQHVIETGMAGQVALLSSQTALQRARNPGVRRFAQFEVEEQTTVAQILQEVSGMVPPPLDARRQAMMADFQRQAAGDFDRAYLTAQRMGHEELLRIQDDYLRSGRNPHNRHIALLARGRIIEHISDVTELMRMV